MVRDGLAIGGVVVDGSLLRRRFSYCNPAECGNACCHSGAAVSVSEIERIERHLRHMSSHLHPEAVKLARKKAFYQKATVVRRDLGTDEECHYLRVVNGSCIFSSPSPAQGCALQLYCQARGMDPWYLKPFVCRIFPLRWMREGRIELTPWQLPCLQPGRNFAAPPLYRSCASELRQILGDSGYARLCWVTEKPEAGAKLSLLRPRCAIT